MKYKVGVQLNRYEKTNSRYCNDTRIAMCHLGNWDAAINWFVGGMGKDC